MDWIETKNLAAAFVRRYRWAAAVLLAGLVLMALPSGEEEPTAVSVQPSAKCSEESDLEAKLETILSRLEGAGKVKVLLSIASGAESYYQSDENFSKNGEVTDKQAETVVITSADRNQHGLLRRVDPPLYQGAVVLCQGADSPRVKLAVVDAVGTVTGLGSDKISVLKMK